MSSDAEKSSKCSAIEAPSMALKLDPHGLPLRPQPSSSPLDPLNWTLGLKLWILFQVSFLAFLGPFTQAVINPAFADVAKSFHFSVTEASYATAVALLGSGIAPVFLSPLANTYGRRPVFLCTSAVGIIGHCGSGAASTWSGILAARFFMGVGTSAGMGIGGAVVADLFFLHERGRYYGVFVVFISNGAHVAGMVGGPVAEFLGWRWCFWIPAIVFAANWVVNLVALPETLYHRGTTEVGGEGREEKEKLTYTGVMAFRTPRGGRGLKLADFGNVFRMLKYPSVLLPALYYSVAFGIGSVMFAVTGAAAFGKIYHFKTIGVGLAIGLPTFIGTLLGEIFGGFVSDRLLYLYAKSHNGDEKPEARLQATWPGAFILPAGVIIEGVCLQYKTHWIGPVMGIGIGAFGLQIVSTNIYAYIVDCYKPQAAEISTLLNFGRQVFSFTLNFYMTPFAEETTYGIAWSVMAIISYVLYIGIIGLMLRGSQWRARLGEPKFDRDL